LTLALLAIVLAIVAFFTRSRPEVVLTVAALTIPAGSFHPSLRTVTSIGQLSPFALTVLVVGVIYVATTPGSLTSGLRAAPGVIGVVTLVLGGLSAVAAWQIGAIFWMINGGLVLILISCLLADRYRTAPQAVELTVVIGGVVLAASVLLEAALGRHVRWTVLDPLLIDFPVFRPAGLAGNSLLGSAAVAVVLAIAVTGRTPVRFRLLVGAVLTSAVIVTLTRSAMIGTVFAVVGFVFHRSRGGQRLTGTRILVLVLGIPTAAFLYLSDSSLFFHRLDGTVLANRSDILRTTNLSMAWGQFLEHPVLGLGLGGFKRYAVGIYGSDLASLATSDNMFLTALVELGVLGALGFAAVAFLLNRRHRLNVAQGLPAGTMVPLIVVGVVSVFFDSLFHDCMLFLFAISVFMAMPPRGERGSTEPRSEVESRDVRPDAVHELIR
jgi:O-antigen ligase/polysaccharide polymerase Wzy-like membrane protein